MGLPMMLLVVLQAEERRHELAVCLWHAVHHVVMHEESPHQRPAPTLQNNELHKSNLSDLSGLKNSIITEDMCGGPYKYYGQQRNEP